MAVVVRFLVAVFQASRDEKLEFVWATLRISETRLCVPLHHLESRPWSMVTGEESANGRSRNWWISPLCNFITEALRWSSLMESISARLLWITFPGCICPHDTYPLFRKVIYSPAAWVTAQVWFLLLMFPVTWVQWFIASFKVGMTQCYWLDLVIHFLYFFLKWLNSECVLELLYLVDLVYQPLFKMLVCLRGLLGRAVSPASPLIGLGRLLLCGRHWSQSSSASDLDSLQSWPGTWVAPVLPLTPTFTR